jgi:hypothetical protein
MSRQRLECVELAPAFGRASSFESASKLVALHTLRESGRQQPIRHFLHELREAFGVRGACSRFHLRHLKAGGWNDRSGAVNRAAGCPRS